MTKTTIELNLRTMFGAAFVIIGLVILGYVSVTAFQLASGVIKPLEIDTGVAPRETAFFLGVILQIGMFAILVAVAYILMRFGLTLILRKEKE